MADETETEHGDNRPEDMILDEKVVKMGEELASIFRKRKALNLEAKNIYTNADKLGIPPRAVQDAVGMVRIMDRDDRKAYQSGVRRVLKALEPAAAELFSEDVQRIAKRKAKDAARAAKAKESATAQEQRVAADSPRSDPKRGGAGGAKGRGKAKDKPAKGSHLSIVSQTGVTTEDVPLVEESGDELIARVAREKMAALEQREGGQILDTAMDGIKSQSEKSADALAKAGLA